MHAWHWVFAPTLDPDGFNPGGSPSGGAAEIRRYLMWLLAIMAGALALMGIVIAVAWSLFGPEKM
jgi:hypothetical protein